MFKRILIANRGEIAVRVFRACRELEIEPVVVYSQADREALHVQLAEQAYCIGPARSADSYLNVNAILTVAQAAGCDAIHPGYGFLSENADFADACEAAGITFIGPSGDVIRAMGNKAAARKLMQSAGVPVVPGSDGAVDTAEQAKALADSIGYPVLIKASAGGGGRGMRRVYEPEQLIPLFEEARSESLACFGSGEMYLEKLIVNPITYHGDCYRRHDEYMLSYVPRELPDGSMAICQEHVTDSLQALMKADYILALNSGHNIRRCIICGRYFLLKSGVHALYCEGACPHAPGYTCRQFGTVELQKELAKDIPKVKVKVTAFARITKDMQRGAISQEDTRKAKDYVRDLLYDALRDANISVEAFEQRISSERVYQRCGITRTANPRGRPPKKKAGEQV